MTTTRETADLAELARIEALLREHIRVDASGLAPAVVSHFVFGFDTAASALLSEIAALRGERDDYRLRTAELTGERDALKANLETAREDDLRHLQQATQAERQRDDLREALEAICLEASRPGMKPQHLLRVIAVATTPVRALIANQGPDQ